MQGQIESFVCCNMHVKHHKSSLSCSPTIAQILKVQCANFDIGTEETIKEESRRKKLYIIFLLT